MSALHFWDFSCILPMYCGCSYFNKISSFIKGSKKRCSCAAMPIPSNRSSKSIFSAILWLTILGLLIYLNFDILNWICSFPIYFLLTASYFCNWFWGETSIISEDFALTFNDILIIYTQIHTHIYKETWRFSYMVWHTVLQFSPLLIFAAFGRMRPYSVWGWRTKKENKGFYDWREESGTVTHLSGGVPLESTN